MPSYADLPSAARTSMPDRTATWAVAWVLAVAVSLQTGLFQRTAVAEPQEWAHLDLARLKAGRTMRSSSSAPEWRNTNEDARPMAPGETVVWADLEGPGVINHIWTTIAPGEIGYSRLMTVRMYWDGEEHPSVECPMGDFFGVGHGIDRSFASAMVSNSSHGRARNCYWPMPFRKSARITVTNEGKGHVLALFWYVDWQKLPSLEDDVAYFHAQYRQEHPTIMGRNYRIADIEGEGHYVGTLLNVRQRTPGWWGEGDDFFFIDGEHEPSLRGTGSEDYFCDAWGLRLISYPYYGVTIWGDLMKMGFNSAYRWHVVDPVTFAKSLRVEIEHKGQTFKEDGSVETHFGERRDDFSSVAFWYQREPHKPYPDLPPPYDRLYHSPSDLVEIEELLKADKIGVSEGEADVQYGPWSGGQQVHWFPEKPGATFSIRFEVKEADEFQIKALLTKAINYGTYQASIDGKPAGKPIDLYEQTFWTNEYALDIRRLEPGEHTMTFECVGSNPQSLGFGLGVDCLLLSPLE